MQATFKDEIKAIQTHIAEHIGQGKYDVWFKHGTRFTLTEESLDVAAASSFTVNWIEGHFSKQIALAVRSITGTDRVVRFSVDASLTPTVAPVSSHRVPRAAASPSARAEFTPPLKLTLDTFIVGAKNQLAFNAAQTVIAEDQSPFNPLFYHGGYGVGKTHLLQGICNTFAKMRTHRRWLYVSAEDFANQYVLALKTRKLDVFRNRLRNLDLLAIDDIHFLANKNAMQEEFLHTFNSIDLAGKQIILASDAHPKMIGQLTDKLVSRFVSGMVIKIDSPDFETRCRICEQKASVMKHKLGKDIVEFIAEHIPNNVRELEGALLKVVAYASVSHQKLALSAVKQLLSEHVMRADPVVHSSGIVAAVAQYFNVSAADIHSAKKDRSITMARSFCMYLSRRLTRMSFPEIGKTLGGKNHATVIMACRKVEESLETNQQLSWKESGGYRNAPAKDVLQELMEQIS